LRILIVGGNQRVTVQHSNRQFNRMKMKKIFTITTFLLWTIFLFGQPQIKFDTTSFDLGQIVQGSRVNKEIYFTNTGTEPLIIQRVATGDGGTMATCPRETILPGEKGVIIFHAVTNGRIGTFNRGISITSNSALSPPYVSVKGEIVYPKTTIKVDDKEKNIGKLHFGNVDTVQFTVINTGNEKLHIRFQGMYDYSECDLLRCEIQNKDVVGKAYSIKDYYPSDTIWVKMLIKNVYGNVGKIERNLIFIYNSHDTLEFKIKGQFIGKPNSQIIYEGHSVFFYNEDKLVKRQEFYEDGRMVREEFFEGAYCIHSIYYSWNKEKFYKNGVLIDDRKYKEADN